MKKEWLIWIVFIVSAVQGFAGESRTLRIGIHNFPISLNPVYVTDETSQAIANKIYHSLFVFDGLGNLRNGVVDEYSVGTGKNLITIRVKDGFYFSDGKRLTAIDVGETIKILKDKRFNYPYASTLDFIRDVSVEDDYTLQLHLNSLLATWRNVLVFKILNAAEIRDVRPDQFREKRLSGSGPYQLGSVKKPTGIQLKINPAHGEKNNGFECIDYSIVPATHLEPLKLLRGEIDICELQPEDVAAYGRIESWRKEFALLKYKKFGFTYMVFNLRTERVPKRIRQLIYNRTQAEGFIERFLNGRGEKVKTPFLLLNGEEIPEPFDVDPLEKQITLKIVTNSESKLRRELILFLRKDLADRRIQLDVEFLEYQMFLSALKKGNFDMAVSGFILDIDYDLKDVLGGESYFNYAGYKDDTMDYLLEAGLRELDPIRRKLIYKKANDRWRQELPILPLFNLYYHVGVSRSVRVPAQVFQLVGSTGDFLDNIIQWGKVNRSKQ